MIRKFYITTAIPYVNAKPHIGHALEFIQADTIARWRREILKVETLFLSGADENAVKNVQAALTAKIPVQQFVDKNAKLFEELAQKLNVRFDVFQKGSDQKHHFPSSQKLWQLCDKSGDIYKKSYKGLYCVGCEQFYTPEELDENGECYEHPGRKPEEVSEENYFFRLSKYQKDLIRVITTDELKIIPATRKNEVLSFLKQPLQDISISRTEERAKKWGVPVPGDTKQRIYVWFDALNIYQSGIGFGWDEKKYNKWWPANAHVIGKGITRFHAVYWPAFLLSAGLKLPESIFVHGYLTIEGQKMSKTLGNVIDPLELVNKYGTDPLRYYLLREIPSYGDGDFSERRFMEVYNADLANGLGNLVARVARLAEGIKKYKSEIKNEIPKEYANNLDEYKFNDALAYVFKKISLANKEIDEKKPWILEGEGLEKVLSPLINRILEIANLLKPFLPDTSEKILKQFLTEPIRSQPPLFPRIK